jgi:hypothetical protein
MPTNDRLKAHPDQGSYLPFSGRYLVFVFNDYFPKGGQGDLLATFNTLSDIEALFKLEPADYKPLKRIDARGRLLEAFQFLDVLDLQERRFIDINELTFEQLN